MHPIDLLGPVVRRRGSLDRTRAALARGRLTVGFLGGSITSAQTGTRWPEPLAAWLTDAFPGVRLTVENAAIGATGSDLAAFRAQAEIIARGCDLVFVEYATNDFGEPTDRRTRTREGLLRQLLRDGRCDVVLAYTYCPEMQPDLFAGIVPSTVAEFEVLAERYRLNSVWMGLHALREVRRGLLTWEEWLPDGLHPEKRGSLSYAQSMMAFMAEALVPSAGTVPAPAALPPPTRAKPDACNSAALFLKGLTRHASRNTKWMPDPLDCASSTSSKCTVLFSTSPTEAIRASVGTR